MLTQAITAMVISQLINPLRTWMRRRVTEVDCVRFDFPYSNESAKKTNGLPQRYVQLKPVFVKQPLCKAT